MYKHNSGRLDYPSTSSGQAKRIHSEMVTWVPNRKRSNLELVTDGYTRPVNEPIPINHKLPKETK